MTVTTQVETCPYLKEDFQQDYEGKLRATKFFCSAKPQIGTRSEERRIELTSSERSKCEQFWRLCPNYLYARQMEVNEACRKKQF